MADQIGSPMRSAAVVWVEAVVDRFRAAILPNGCGPAGEPVDGSSFWPWENMWMLHFAAALRNATGVDLYREFPRRLELPLRWFCHHLSLPGFSGDNAATESGNISE